MSTLISRIQKAQVDARKARDSVATALLTTLLSACNTKAKDANKAFPSDAEVVAEIKKFQKSNAEMQLHAKGDALDVAKREEAILLEFLPKQLSEEELESIIRASGKTVLGEIMTMLKQGFEGQYDGKMASTVARRVIG